MIYDNNQTLVMYFSVWKMIDVSDLTDNYIGIYFTNKKWLVLRFNKEKSKNQIAEGLITINKSKRRYFPAIPFTICEKAEADKSTKFLREIYENEKFPLVKPRIWGKEFPQFLFEMDHFKYEKPILKGKLAIKKKNVKVKRRKSSRALLSLDFDQLEKEGYIEPLGSIEEEFKKEENIEDDWTDEEEEESSNKGNILESEVKLSKNIASFQNNENDFNNIKESEKKVE